MLFMHQYNMWLAINVAKCALDFFSSEISDSIIH